MIPDEVIERCAMALREHVANRALGTMRHGRPWLALPARLREDYRAEAKIVLECAARVRCG
jgi:hypothetical protein